MVAAQLVGIALIVGACLITILICTVILRRAIQARHAAEQSHAQVQEERRLAEQKLQRSTEEHQAADTALQKAEEERAKANATQRDTQKLLEKVALERAAAQEKRSLAEREKRAAEDAARRVEQERRDAENAVAQAQESLNVAREEHLKAAEEHAAAQQTLQQASQERALAQADLAKSEALAAETTEKVKQAVDKASTAEQEAQLASERARQAEKAQHEAEVQAQSLIREVVETQARAQESEQAERNAQEDRDRTGEMLALAEDQWRREEGLRHDAEAERDRVRIEKGQIEKELVSTNRAVNELAHKNEQLRSRLRETENELKRLRNIPKYDTAEIVQNARKNKLKRPPRRGIHGERPGEESSGSVSPEIICLERQHQWDLLVEVPKELSVKEVTQNYLQLEPDDPSGRCWHLVHGFGTVEIDSIYDIPDMKLGTKAGNEILFKLTGKSGLKQGRRVSSITKGAYLIVVPETWQPEDPSLLSESQSVSVADYHAFFCLIQEGGDTTTTIAFRTSEGGTKIVRSGKQEFTLIGTRINDATQDIGPLFAKEPPRIRALNSEFWRQVSAIVVGEEGGGKPDWEANVIPGPPLDGGDPEVDLTDLRGSWFYARLYDCQDILIESMDFRYIQGLDDLKIVAPAPIPSPTGHEPACLEFYHAANCVVEPATDVERQLSIERENSKTMIQVPGRPEYDETVWSVGSEDGEIGQVRILVERVWWAVSDENIEPAHWGDHAITLQRKDIAATSDRALWIRLPKPGWAQRIKVWRDPGAARNLAVKTGERVAVLALRDLRDAWPPDFIGMAPLTVEITHQGQTEACTPARLKAQAFCRFAPCQFSTTDMAAMSEHIKSHHLGNLFQPLRYEELRAQRPDLPTRIAICLHKGCDYVARSYGPEKVTDMITRHFRDRHPARGLGSGIHFRELHGIAEIREKAPDLALPYVLRCTRPGCDCTVELPEQTPAAEAEMVQHWLVNHPRYLFEVR